MHVWVELGEDRNYRVDIFSPNEQEEYRRHSSLIPGYQEVFVCYLVGGNINSKETGISN
jgi:hypothetical protein